MCRNCAIILAVDLHKRQEEIGLLSGPLRFERALLFKLISHLGLHLVGSAAGELILGRKEELA